MFSRRRDYAAFWLSSIYGTPRNEVHVLGIALDGLFYTTDQLSWPTLDTRVVPRSPYLQVDEKTATAANFQARSCERLEQDNIKAHNMFRIPLLRYWPGLVETSSLEALLAELYATTLFMVLQLSLIRA
jgi:hypothetical protein